MAWINRRYAVLNRILQSGCRILALQEVMPAQINFLRDGLHSHLSAIWHSREFGPSEGLALIYDNQSLAVLEEGCLPIGDFGKRSYMACCPRIIQYAAFLRLATLDTAVVINCHFDHVSTTSRVQGALLARNTALSLSAKYETDMVFVLGDFNCGEQSPEIELLAKLPLVQVRQEKANAEWTFDTNEPHRRIIDHLFTLVRRPMSLSVDQNKPCSDHRMVVA